MAERKSRAIKLRIPHTDDALAFLMAIVNDPNAPAALRMRAAISAAPYQHSKQGAAGKKEKRQERAHDTSTGRFAPRAAPPLKKP